MKSDVREVLRGIRGVEVKKSPEFKRLTTIGTGGRARALVLPKSQKALGEVMKRLRREEVKYFVFGRGSNIIVPDRGVDLVAVSICGHLTDVRFNGRGIIADGGTSLPRLSVLSALSGLTGLEEFSGIPGALGGALVMNAGAYGREIGELVRWVEVVDEQGETHRIPPSLIDFGYRKAVFPVHGIVSRAYLVLERGDSERVFSRMKELNRRRKDVQPWGEKSFGSVFKNPPGDSAGRLIEEAGLKGLRVGNARVSEKHANFIVNRGGARTRDVLSLISKVREIVSKRKNIDLELEVKCIG
ncbi:MAG: UDP-N-acetylmuramate dehydrogenase [Deltaproteobacteria bacterium]|nr:UDP-N-acetylmuramate dehydrogenase [Deltaproteobacteria bacterium]NIS78515.1 UDP-N-acetylmuramate dehydrogenase [Deltaproteobacteria bacterium]